jgi:hypothetical protein
VEEDQVFIDGKMDKQNVVYPHDRITQPQKGKKFCIEDEP